MTLAPETRPGGASPSRTKATGERRARVGLVTGCVQRVFFGDVNEATARLLSAEGCEVVAPRQGCCGALALHAGRDEEARQFARELIRAFDDSALDAVVINAAGCGSTMKGYGELLRTDPEWAARASAFSAKVRDVSEILCFLGPPRAVRHALNLRVAYHDACHLGHAQGIRREPRELIESIPGVTLVPLADSEICCGSAGIFNLVEPEMAGELGRRKASRIAEAGPDVVVTSNPGCMLQIGAHSRAAGQRVKILHIVELLDAAVRNQPVR
jgi:glycolate oxidase iron-sulfur subunit